jgi:DNA polymerase I-like protein with 3'-5' exonuclease and polymerase domains
MKKLVLIDGHAVFHRAYHALPPLTTSKGELVNAVFGFTSMLLRSIADIKPDYIAVAFDTREPTFRHQEYTAYKAQRIAGPEELHDQLPRAKEVVEALNIPIFELAGYEADDIIGTLVEQATSNKQQVTGLETIIVTGDRDTLQLVRPGVKVYTPGKSFSDVVYFDEKSTNEKYGLEPTQLIDFKALAGDQSDNIPGVRGIGEVTAKKLLQEFGSLENIYKNLEKIPEKARNLLAKDAEGAALSKKLATIDVQTPVKLDLSKCVLKDYDQKAAEQLFLDLEFRSLIPKLPGFSQKAESRKQIAEGQEGLFDKEKEEKTGTSDDLEKVLREMEDYGVFIDTKKLVNLAKEIDSKLSSLEKEIYKQVGHEFNLNSPKQLSAVLYDELNLTPERSTRIKTHKSTDEATLSTMVGAHPVIELLLQYRELFKLKSTYVDALPNQIGPDGRIHTHYHTDITRTGRLSSKDPNLQNIPARGALGEKVRSAFIAPTGSVLLSGDYNQIELRVMAHISGDEALKKVFEEGHDIHTETAEAVLGKKHGEVTKEDRRIAKIVNFGIMYGISPYGLATQLKTEPAAAKEIIDRYFERFPGVREWVGAILRETYEKGFVETLGGFKRYVLELRSNNQTVRRLGERIAVNSPIQGTGADIIKKAMVGINEKLKIKNEKTKMIMQVHDELVFEVPEEELEEVAPMIKEVMETAFPLSVPLIVELKVGKNWGEMKSLNN